MIPHQTTMSLEPKHAPRTNRIHNLRRLENPPVRSALTNLRDEFRSVIIRPTIFEAPQNDQSDNSYTIFEDPKLTKMYYEKYIQVRVVLGFVMFASCMLALTICERNRWNYGNVSNELLIMSFMCTALQVVVIVLWPIGVYYNGLLKREKLLLSDSVGVFAYYGRLRFFGMLVLLFIHPFYVFLDMDSPVEESYFTKYQRYAEFKRPIAEYLLLIQIFISAVNIITICLESLKMGNTRSDRIARFFSIEADLTYVVRTTMQRQPILFSCFMYIFALLFFSTMFRITENCYPIRIYNETGDFDMNKASYMNYTTSLWMVVITMATIGYGDVWIGATLSRVVIMFTGLCGILMTSLFVLVSLNVLKMDRMEEITYELIRNTVYRVAKDKYANDLISHVLTSTLRKVKNDDSKRMDHKSQIFKYFDRFKAEHDKYRLSCDSKTHHINAKAFQIKHKIEQIYKSAVPVERPKRQNKKHSYRRSMVNSENYDGGDGGNGSD